MKKVIALLLVAAVAIVALAEYTLVSVDAPYTASSVVGTDYIKTGKVIGIEAYNVVSNKTIILYHVYPDSSTTNTVSTQTTTVTTGQNQTFDLSSSGYFWISKGETWLRGGTETNAVIRLILEE